MEDRKCHKAAFTGFRQISPINEGLAILNPYMTDEEEDSEETKKLNSFQRILVSETPSDLRLKILHRLPQQWGVDVKRVAHLPMASWYNPVSLLSTVVNVFVTFAIGERTDTRPLYALMDTVDALSKELAAYKQRPPSVYSSALAPAGSSSTAASTLSSGLHRESSASFDSFPHPSSEIRSYHSYELHGSKTAFFFDFVADTGDGWNPTFTVATLLAQPLLEVYDKFENKTQCFERGRLLVLGGDLCYPDPSTQNYKSRFVEPFRHALWPERDTKHSYDANDRRQIASSYGHPHAFAIPGNHDWLDGLVAFRRIMCGGHRLGGWLLPQKRSYFAIQLPDGWWLFGIDDQLTYDIDDAQFRYFRDIAASMASTDRVIVAMHRPFWILDGKPREVISVLFERSLGDKLRLILAGDLHNYSRYERTDSKMNLVVCGGGGGFLHPTHNLQDSVTVENTVMYSAEYGLKKVYPSKQISRDLCFESLMFLTKNYSFGLVTAFVYLFMVGFLPWTLWVHPIAEPSNSSSGNASVSMQSRVLTATHPIYLPLSSPLLFFSFLLQAVLWSPLSFSLFALLWICLGVFVDIGSQSRFWSVLIGFVHTCAHLCVAGFGHFLAFQLLVQPYITESFKNLDSFVGASTAGLHQDMVSESVKMAVSSWASSHNYDAADAQSLVALLSSSLSQVSNAAATVAAASIASAASSASSAVVSHSALPLLATDASSTNTPFVLQNHVYLQAAMLFFNNVSIVASLLARCIVCVVGLVGGPAIMGLYFTIAARVFNRHEHDLFAGTRIEDYKSFLRLKIDAEKHTLTVISIGVDKVKTEWPALRGKGKLDETTAHMTNPLWYTPQSVDCHIIEKLTVPKF